MRNKKISGKIKSLAFSQIIILIIGIVAVGYLIGDIGLVSAQEKVKVPKNTENFATPGLIGYINSIYGTPSKIDTTTAKDLTTSLLQKEVAEEVAVETPAVTTGTTAGIIGSVGSILYAAGYAAGAYLAVRFIAEKLGAKPGPAKALAAGAAAGVFIGASGAGNAIAEIIGIGSLGGPAGWIVAGVIAIITTLLTWKDEKQKQVLFMCDLWQPQPGGKDCEQCNDGPFPCSEYQCSSLGVSCQIVNKGTKDQKCMWINRNNVTTPIMTPWQDALKTGYYYLNNTVISPPNRGVFVKYNGTKDGCVPPYTSFNFGVKVNVEAKCRADIIRQSNFSLMRIPLSGERYIKGHEIVMSWPNMKDLEAENIINITGTGKEHKLYIKCVSGNGVETNAHLEFSYCIDDSPDLNPPKIVETNIDNGASVRFGIGKLDNFIASIDKPGQCKWSTLDKTYGDMENTMTCGTTVRNASAKGLYDCKTDLTGIKDREKNDFYFRCKGTYNNKTSTESYKFTLVGSQPLVIEKVGPNETIRDSTDPVKVNLTAETSAGAERGKATCQYSATGEENDYVTFYNTDSYTHSQELGLSEGDYTYYIKCFDIGGNSDVKTTNFTIEIDRSSPVVVRAFHEGDNLKIMTNEEAECVYDVVRCLYEFDDGIPMTTINNKEHYVKWDIFSTFYIKCKDKYGNRPAQDICSIKARPFTL